MFCVICDGVGRTCALFFFFLQAEDGIRDLGRSRGLGEVYKRQVFVTDLGSAGAGGLGIFLLHDAARVRASGGVDVGHRQHHDVRAAEAVPQQSPALGPAADEAESDPVSFTHLTLPASDLVETSGGAVSLKKKKKENKKTQNYNN